MAIAMSFLWEFFLKVFGSGQSDLRSGHLDDYVLREVAWWTPNTAHAQSVNELSMFSISTPVLTQLTPCVRSSSLPGGHAQKSTGVEIVHVLSCWYWLPGSLESIHKGSWAHVRMPRTKTSPLYVICANGNEWTRQFGDVSKAGFIADLAILLHLSRLIYQSNRAKTS